MERQMRQLSDELRSRREQFDREREAFEMVRREMEQLRSASIDLTVKEWVQFYEKRFELYVWAIDHNLLSSMSITFAKQLAGQRKRKEKRKEKESFLIILRTI